jgi:flagellum-specific ATP synthase
MPNVVSDEHNSAAGRVSEVLATYADAEDLINIGAYKTGSSPKIDWAIKNLEPIRNFLMQAVNERSSYAETKKRLLQLAPNG